MSRDEIIEFVDNRYDLDPDILDSIGTDCEELSELLDEEKYDLLAEIIDYYESESIQSLLSDDNPHSKKDYSCFNTVLNNYHPDDGDEWY